MILARVTVPRDLLCSGLVTRHSALRYVTVTLPFIFPAWKAATVDPSLLYPDISL